MTIGGRMYEDNTVIWRDDGQIIDTCEYSYSMAYVNSKDPVIGPGLQDMIDIIDWVKDNYPVDHDRVYGIGVSLGGRGMYATALKAPDLFAAIALMHPASDEFDLDIRLWEMRRGSRPCRMALAGGKPGTSDYTATMRTLQSGRFLIENAYHIPIFIGHTDDDQIAWNVKGTEAEQYCHSYHMLFDTTWNGCYYFEGKAFCFGHTPTLSELQGRHSDGYKYAYMFSHSGSRNGHRVDSRWITGTKKEPNEPSLVGVEDPEDPLRLLGAIDFLSRYKKVNSPETVVFKTYTDDVRKAYWLEIDMASPWTNTPAGIRATRDSESNNFALELSRVETVTIDLRIAELDLNEDKPLTINIRPLIERVYDPALSSKPGEVMISNLVLKGNFRESEEISVMRDNAHPGDKVILEKGSLKIILGDIVSPTCLQITRQP